MNYTYWQKFKLWLCRKFGHKSKWVDNGDNEICSRCSTLLSTSYSRHKDAMEKKRLETRYPKSMLP